MNIYHVTWMQSAAFKLNAVVIAPSANQALNVLQLESSETSDVFISQIGVTTEPENKLIAGVIAEESL